MKKYLGVALALAVVAVPAIAQDAREEITGSIETNVPAVNAPIWEAPEGATVLVNNGPLATSTGTGAGGADESVLQNTSLGMTTLGLGHQMLNGNRVADDFTLATDATLNTCTFFAYQTGSTMASTITAVNARIWDGTPGAPGSNVIFGDTTTNILTSSVFSNIYRVAETTLGANNRPIMANTTAFGGVALAPGTYWLDWQTNGSLGSGPWAPVVTITGNPSTGNGLQSLVDNGVTWAAANDGGNLMQQGFPFICTGTVAAFDPLVPTLDWRGLAILLLALSSAAFFMMRRRTA